MAGFLGKIFDKIVGKAHIDWDELEADLVSSDLGIRLSMEIIDELRGLGREVTPEDAARITRQHIGKLFEGQASANIPPPAETGPIVILVVGVNGTGKTTSSAKLAHWLDLQGHSVLLAAADTFRAAAVEQLERWADRLAIDYVKGAHQADPASVCYTAHQKAIADNYEYLICDTAGRLHTKHNLMDELGKIRRTLGKQDGTAPHLSLLVVDATTGSNALNQAREFHKAAPLDGLIVTKMDGSGKGGIAASIQKELSLSPYFLGTGEEPSAFTLFDLEEYIEGIL